MKKYLMIAMLIMLTFIVATPVLAGAKNSTDLYWTWPAGSDKNAYFMTTGSGIVQGWTYDHPDMGDAKWIFKPLSKFKNATECDEGWIGESPNWNPHNLYNVMSAESEPEFWGIFNKDTNYLFCAYPME